MADQDKFSLTIFITEFFDDLISKIDVEAEKLLMNLTNHDEATRRMIDSERFELISSIKSIEKENLDYLNENFESIKLKLQNFQENDQIGIVQTYEFIKELFIKYCYYIKRDFLANYPGYEYLGVLVITDWIITDKQLNFLISIILPTKTPTASKNPRHNKKKVIEQFPLSKERLPCFIIEQKINKHQYLRDHIIFIFKDVLKNVKSISIQNYQLEFANELEIVDFFTSLNSLLLKNTSIHSIDQIWNTSNLTRLCLAENHIQSVNEEAFLNVPSLKELDLSSNYISELPTTVFSALENLETLNLTKNQIKAIHSGTFIGLSCLRELYISENKLVHIEKNQFKGLSGLEVLDLNNNNITIADLKPFIHLDNLRELRLKSLEKDFLGKHFFEGINLLEKLILDECTAIKIDRTLFQNLKRLKFLFINTNNIQKMDNRIFSNLKNLEVLELTFKSFNICPLPSLSKLKMIKSLRLGFCTIKANKLYVFNNLKNLEQLDLRDSILDMNISEHFFTYLSIGSNSKRFLAGLNKLKSLKLSTSFDFLKNNPIESIKNLEYLRMSQIDTKFIEMNMLEQYRNLKELTLTNNNINAVDSDAFLYLSFLERLDLSSNLIEDLATNSFEGLSNLLVLDLSNNKIEWLTDRTFSESLLNLKYLNLSQNVLSSIERYTFEPFINLVILDLRRNIISCYNVSYFCDMVNLNQLFLDNYLLEMRTQDLPPTLLVNPSLENQDNKNFTCDIQFN